MSGDAADRLAKAIDDEFSVYERGPGHDPDKADTADIAAVIRKALAAEGIDVESTVKAREGVRG